MPEPFSAERLNQLRQRWERDPKSRSFLQLAEEYRRGGRLADAVHVLEAGLKEHPTYLSAQVALGRCLLENGTPGAARELLEKAVARDPTQLVANKLLVEAYLALGQAGKARERLDLYKLFNDRDEEIGPLEARIRALDGLPEASPAAPGVTQRGAERGSQPSMPFHLPPVAALPEVRLEPPAAHRLLRTGAARSEPFGELYAAGAARRIALALAEEGIFAHAPAAVPAETEAGAGPQEWEAASWGAGTETGIADDAKSGIEAEIETGIAPPDEEPVATPEAVRLDEGPTEAVPEPPPAASSTLGELYLAQGHLDDAEVSFETVLRNRPGDAAALAGLEAVRSQRGEEAEAFSEEPVVTAESAESNVVVGGLTARKVALLKDYLARIKHGAQRHVS